MDTYIYGQTGYNLLNNSILLKDYISVSLEYGYKYLTLTDSNLYAAFKFLNLCKKNNIKPILGLEIDVIDSNYKFKMLAYAKDIDGYKSLVKLSSNSKVANKVFEVEELTKYSGITFISTFEDSFFLLSLKESSDKFISLVKKYKDVLKDFYVGISNQNLKNKNDAQYMYEICVSNNIDAIPLHQTLYLKQEDNTVYEALRKINQTNDIKFGDYFLPTKENLDYEFANCPKLNEGLKKFLSNIKDYMPHAKISLPTFKNDLNLSSDTYLKELCIKGCKRRFEIEHVASFEAYMDRLNYELNVISKMGYQDYFLIVWDYVRYAKKNSVMVGPGRGSACGSLVAYSLGITNVDPLKYNLLFERFLNPERVTMPDIDMDFPTDKRNEVIDYVKEKYGKNRVCNITAFDTFQLKSSIQDLGRVLGIDKAKLKVLSNVAGQAKDFEDLLNKFKDNIEIYNLLIIAKKLENLPRHISTHAAGIVLSNDNLDELVPLQNGINNLYQAQWDKDDIEAVGLLKMDFLGVKNLNIVSDCVNKIDTLNNISLQYIPLNDKNTFELLQRGDTLGIFQLEGEGIKKVLIKLKPNSLDDIVAVLALYRPGPMDQINEFIDRKNGKKFEYLHKDLEPILKSTYGIIVYQEQIMLIAHDFAGLSLGEADVLRRAVSKKNKELLDSQRVNFVEHCVKNNYSKEIANQIYDYIVKFAEYGFNKAHAVGYALLSYQMAYIKANYFNIFMSNLLNSVIGNQSDVVSYIRYARLHKMHVYEPNINESDVTFKIYKDGLIFPLSGIFGIGLIQASQIVKERENGLYKSLDDFKKRTSLNSNSIINLIYSDSFDLFGHSKKTLVDEANNNISTYSRFLDDVIGLKEEEFDEIELKRLEAKMLGLNIKYDNFKNIEIIHRNYNASFISRKSLNKDLNTIIQFENIKEIKTKKGDPMAFGSATDGRISFNFVIFPKEYEIFKDILDKESIFLAFGHVSFDDKYKKVELKIANLKKI